MGTETSRLRAGWSIVCRRSGLLGLVLGLGLLAALAAGSVAAQSALVINSDRGGVLNQYAQRVSQLSQSGQRVELRGTCYSACTMYLGLRNVCIHPNARFGFHGPSRRGRPLPLQEFDRWSHMMANHYREPLRSWFLSTARHQISGYHRLSGAQLISMGYPSC